MAGIQAIVAGDLGSWILGFSSMVESRKHGTRIYEVHAACCITAHGTISDSREGGNVCLKTKIPPLESIFLLNNVFIS